MTKYLSIDDLRTLAEVVKNEITRKGAGFYGWRNAPAAELGRSEADKVWEEKLNGAYGERFALSVAVAVAAAQKGHKVALLQIQKEERLPFNAEGWLVLSLDGFPLFHLAPWDLLMTQVEGLVTLITEGSPEAETHKWKGTDKVGELSMLLDWMF